MTVHHTGPLQCCAMDHLQHENRTVVPIMRGLLPARYYKIQIYGGCALTQVHKLSLLSREDFQPKDSRSLFDFRFPCEEERFSIAAKFLEQMVFLLPFQPGHRICCTWICGVCDQTQHPVGLRMNTPGAETLTFTSFSAAQADESGTIQRLRNNEQTFLVWSEISETLAKTRRISRFQKTNANLRYGHACILNRLKNAKFGSARKQELSDTTGHGKISVCPLGHKTLRSGLRERKTSQNLFSHISSSFRS